MPLSWLPAIRVILLIAVITAVLQATVLNRWVQRVVFDRWIALGERLGQPASMRSFPGLRMARAFPLLMAAIFFALWWYLGTTAGIEWARTHLVRHA